MNDHNTTLSKVTIFVTRDRSIARELLIVRSSDERLGLPGDIVAFNEASELAALRVIRAMTGLDGTGMLHKITVLTQQLAGDEFVLSRPVLLRTKPNPDASLMRFNLDRGMAVRRTEMQEDFVRIVYEEYQLEENELTISTRRAGWVLSNSLTQEIEHHLFHMAAPPDMPDLWTVDDAEGDTLRLYWLPIDHVSGIDEDQRRWLEQVKPMLG